MEWRPYAKPTVAAMAGATLLWVAFVMDSRVPLLAMFDLGIHELGHLVTRPLGMVVSFIMGSGFQILVPLGFAVYFWGWNRDRVSSGLVLCWAATAIQDVSVYVADAPYRSIQLIGGTHDWWWLLGRWQKLALADELANGIWALGLVIGLAGLGIIMWPIGRDLWDWLGGGPALRVRVREPRPPRLPS